MTQVEIKAKKFADRLEHWQPTTDEINPLINKEVSNFRKQADKVEFLRIVINEIQIKYDHHLLTCKNRGDDKTKCITNQRYDELLFHLTDALDDLPDLQSNAPISPGDREAIELMLGQIMTELKVVSEAHQISSIALAGEVDLIKSFLWQNRGSFQKELLAKFFDYTAGAAVTVAAAPEIHQLGDIVRKMLMKE